MGKTGSPPHRLFAALLCLMGPYLYLSAPDARAEGERTIMILFDGSGSMWGKLGGRGPNKLRFARDALRDVLEGSKAKPRLGLASMGSKRRRDCSDAGVLLPPDSFDVERIMDPLDNLNPKGRGPITLALRETASELEGTDGPISIIVLHDGVDNCQQDPCEFAKEFARDRPGTAVHVISMGLNKDDLGAMRCIAKVTGGKHFDAQDKRGVSAAMAKAWALANRGGISRPKKRRARQVAAIQPPSQAPFKGSGLLLSAVMGAKSAPLPNGVLWRVLKEGQTAGPPLQEVKKPLLGVPLPTGSYIVEARHGLASARQTFTVTAGKVTRGKLVFNAGSVLLNASVNARAGSAGSNGAPWNDALVTIYKPAPGKAKEGARRTGAPLMLLRATTRPIVLPAGDYVVSLERGWSRLDRALKVAPGSHTELDLTPGGGHLLLRAAPGKNAKPYDDALFIVMEDDPDAPQGRREIARAAGPQASFRLASGAYTVLASTGSARTVERIAVKPGATTEHTMALKAARLQLSAKLGETAAPASQPSAFKIIRLDGAAGTVIRTGRPTPRLAIAPGRYRVESRIGLANALSAYEIEIAPGQDGRLVLKHKAGLVRFRLADQSGGPPLGNVFWQVTDAAGVKIWQTGRPKPQEAFAQGRYVVTAEQLGRRFEKTFDVRPGDNKTVELLVR